MKHLTLKHYAFHVQIQLHTLTVYTASVDDWFGSFFYFLFFFIFFLDVSHYLLFCPSSQDCDGFILRWKGGKGVDIHFSRLKWSTLKNQTEINKYQQIITTDQLTSATAFFLDVRDKITYAEAYLPSYYVCLSIHLSINLGMLSRKLLYMFGLYTTTFRLKCTKLSAWNSD